MRTCLLAAQVCLASALAGWPPAHVGWHNTTTGSEFVTARTIAAPICHLSSKPTCVLVESCRQPSGFLPCPKKGASVTGILYRDVVKNCKCTPVQQTCSAKGQEWSSCAPACDATCENPKPVCVKGCFARCFCPPGPGNTLPVLHNGECIAHAQCPKKEKCGGGQVWNDCGSACTPTCLNPNPVCTKQCVPRCGCPADKPLLHGGKCVSTSSCPSILPVPGTPSTCPCLPASQLPGGMSKYATCKRHFPQDQQSWCYVGKCGAALHYRSYNYGGPGGTESKFYVKYACDSDVGKCDCLGDAFPGLGKLGTCGAHTSLDLMQHGIHAKHWCYVGACGKALGYEARVVRFSEGLFSGAAFSKTLYVKPDCNVVPATATPPALTTTLAPTTTLPPTTTAPPTHVIEPVSTIFQAAAAPFPAWGVGLTKIVLSAADCHAACMAQPACKFGTFIKRGNVDDRQAGQCWLSDHTWSAGDKLRRCGVQCLSFKKVPFTGTHQSDIPMEPVNEVVPQLPLTRCQCDPKAHASLLTRCFDDPRTHTTKVRHVGRRFHPVPLLGGEAHRCRWYRSDPNAPHTFTWIMKDLVDHPVPGTNVTGGHMAARPPWIGQYKHLKNAKECQDLCELNPKCKYATFMQAAWGHVPKEAAINGEWVTLTYHSCYLSEATYMRDDPVYAPVCVGCDNFAKVKCHGCDRKGYDCECCDCHGDGSPISISKLGFGAFMAKKPAGGSWIADGSNNIKKSFAECANQCTKTANCIFGTFTESGECWLSAKAHEAADAGVCRNACYSFVKSHDNKGQSLARR